MGSKNIYILIDLILFVKIFVNGPRNLLAGSTLTTKITEAADGFYVFIFLLSLLSKLKPAFD